MASIAESIGATRPQERSNIDNYVRLYEYFLRYRKINNNCDNARTASGGAQGLPLQEQLMALRTEVDSGKSKNVEVLRLSAQICRQMKGIRFTSCKSAKDRTGMSITLEQCRILSDEYHLAEHEFQKALDCMRSEGCRIENTMKNIGLRKFAFNSVQLLTFPKYYKPPPGTYGSAQT